MCPVISLRLRVRAVGKVGVRSDFANKRDWKADGKQYVKMYRCVLLDQRYRWMQETRPNLRAAAVGFISCQKLNYSSRRKASGYKTNLVFPQPATASLFSLRYQSKRVLIS